MRHHRLLIPLKDYTRAFRVIYAVLGGVDANITKACLFFSLAGAGILKKHYKKNAMPVAGSAFYRVHDETDSVLAFSQMNSNSISSSNEAFHSWILCEDFIIDFMSPLFKEASFDAGLISNVPRKMFQKPSELMSDSFNNLMHEGDFYLEPNIELTKSLFQGLAEKPANADLAEICMHWFKKPPKKMLSTFSMVNDLGRLTNMKLSSLPIEGTW